MKYVVAVSGGVDSVVLLHKLVSQGEHELVVAHFDHGIRKESHLDAQFVERLSNKYKLPFEVRREELGVEASEELARDRRYAFLRSVAKKYDATIATAHHMNDIAETIAINLTRGTGWRGLAVLASGVYRPLLSMTKHEIIDYAEKKGLDWREDSTNASDAYLRNRLRRKLTDQDVVLELATLRTSQIAVRDSIDKEVTKLLATESGDYSRYFFTHIDDRVAIELLFFGELNEFTVPH